MIVPTNFEVPPECNHRWLLVCGHFVSSIEGVRGRNEIDFHDFGVQMPERISSLAMDWMQESIEHLRHLCGSL